MQRIPSPNLKDTSYIWMKAAKRTDNFEVMECQLLQDDDGQPIGDVVIFTNGVRKFVQARYRADDDLHLVRYFYGEKNEKIAGVMIRAREWLIARKENEKAFDLKCWKGEDNGL